MGHPNDGGKGKIQKIQQKRVGRQIITRFGSRMRIAAGIAAAISFWHNFPMDSADETKTTDEKAAIISVWRLGGLHWKTLAKGVWVEIYAGGLLTHAAALSFYFLFSLFPLLLFLVTLLGFFAEYGTELRSNLLSFLSRVVPRSASALIYTTVDETVANAEGVRLWVGLLSALWFSS